MPGTITSVPWEELVTTALLGTDRRPAGADAGPAGLLDAAALHTVRRRAGLLPAAPAARPDPAPADPRPPLPPAARHRLARLLADRSASGGSGGRRGTAPDLTELIPQWLATANQQGFRAPAELLPALLDAARARTDLRPHALAFAGPRGLWLAGLNPEWKFALRGSSGGSPLPGPTEPEAVARLWEEGLFAERVALLAAVRAQDPAGALALLATTWTTERAEDRLMFLDSLRTGLSPVDEPFLEQALSDRSRNVRSTAAELLSALPESALAGRMASRALSCVSPDLTGDEASVAVEAPHECDAPMERDGVVAVPPSGRGERSWWLGQLVEATPLTTWPTRFGGRSAREIVALPVADGWAEELHAAWCRATVRQRDPEWARALLGAPSLPPSSGPGTSSLAERSKLLGILPAAERGGWVADFIAAHGLSEAFQLLGVCPTPWAEPLGRAVVDALDIARDAGSYPWSFSGVMGLAERCLNPAEADRLEVLTTTPDEPEDASPGANGYWSEAFQRLVSTLRLRAAMDAELIPA
ncbi:MULTISPECIES: DUF5691 domain-containing protein [unclassified Streptomyces]|uniref:DUF5691 domain-containing protein n=1 Tax=unclassified Streptomyces TaxID=2593676 RepID=UPI002E75A08D|nr:DUF5691 domain-containing protein [Streptomyces sp. JV184]MEE1750358.1 DUF5691 domain-containing protein [Streptomyces sp. JV184]